VQSDPLRTVERTKAVQSDLGTVMVKRRAIVATKTVENTHKSFKQTVGATACGGPPTSHIPSCVSPGLGPAGHRSRAAD